MIFLWLVVLSCLAVGSEASCSNAPCMQADYRSYSRCIQNQCPNAVVATGCDQGGCASVYQPSPIPPPPPPMMIQRPITVYQPPPPPPPMYISAPPQPQVYQPQPQSCVVNMPYQQCPQQCPSCVYQPYQMGGMQSGCVPSPTWPFVRCPQTGMQMYGGFHGMSGYPGMPIMQQPPMAMHRG